ncbi:MAG: hypothetical protein NVS4B8_24020 [Herpetosiphon sp.]
MSRIVVYSRSNLADLQRDLHRMLRQDLHQNQGPTLHQGTSSWAPQIDVWETEEALIVLAELAGMRDAEVEVVVADDMLILSGRRAELHHGNAQRFFRLEINEGQFQAAVHLPVPIVEQEINARYDDGLLTVTLPKRRPNIRRIPIQQD